MNNIPSCLCLIDGSGYIFRAFYALPPMHRLDGLPTNAVYGFSSMMLNLLTENICSNLVVVFDAKRKNFRNNIFPEYKSNRKELPAELIPQFSLIRQACDALNVPWIEKEGYEADDLIATYSQIAKKQGIKVRIISADKDLMQLIDENTSLYDPMKKKDISNENVIEKFGVPPNKIVDVQALMGDAIDNIPGAKGIGPKTAAQLINQFGSIEEIYQKLDQMKPSKQLDNLKNCKEDVFISKQLASLDKNVPMDIEIEKFQRQNLDIKKAQTFLIENNFPSLIKRLPESHPSLFPLSKTNFHSLTSEKEVNEMVQNFLSLHEFSFSINQEQEQIETISFSNGNDVFEIKSENNSEQIDLFNPKTNEISQKIWHILKPLFESSIVKITWDIKKAFHLLKKQGIVLSSPFDDIMLMSYLIEGNRNSFVFSSLIQKYLNQLDINKKEKAAALMRIFPILTEKLKQENLISLYKKIDLPLIDFLIQMEENGILIQSDQLKKLNNEFEIKISNLSDEIYSEAQEKFNINSPIQLGSILFEKRNLPNGKKGASGHWITDVKVLEKLAEENGDKLAELILKYRALAKLKSTYIDDLIERSQKSSYIHTTFSMVATNTGRLASSNPNLQNIPIKSDEGKQIRSAFIAKEGSLLLSADYSQIELRLISHVANIQKLKESFIHNEDIHARTASQILGIPLKEVTLDQRRNAKAVNFGIIYGISGFGLARNLHIDRTTANNYIRAYFEQYPEIKNYMEKTEKFADLNGYVLTPFGRKIYIEGLNNPTTRAFAHRAAINAPIQGGAADIMKIAMNKVNLALKQSNIHALPLLQIHDELIFEVPEKEADRLAQLVREQMETAVQLSVPLIVEIGIGKNWKDAH